MAPNIAINKVKLSFVLPIFLLKLSKMLRMNNFIMYSTDEIVEQNKTTKTIKGL